MDEKNRENLSELASKIEDGKATDKEIILFNRWYHNIQKQNEPEQKISPAVGRAIKKMVDRRISDSGRNFYLYFRWSVAAAILFFILVGINLWRQSGIDQHTIIDTVLTDVYAGGNRATIFIDGQKPIILDGENGELVSTDSSIISSGNKKALFKSPISGHSSSSYVTLVVPKGGTYKVRLSDGTDVWLNADTRLKYPLNFSGNERLVELEGEAYFEVTKNEHPFIVSSEGQRVQVLGTKFNVNTHEKYNGTKTSLLEGKVQIYALSSKVILLPGEIANVSASRISKTQGDVWADIAWKEGFFSFDHKSFSEIFGEVSRWYDIDIEYPGGVPEVPFFGRAYRTSNLSVILNLLESGKVEYRMVLDVKTNRKKLIINNKNERR